MSRGVSEFLDQCVPPSVRSDAELVSVFIYYLISERGQELASAAEIKACFEECDLRPPKRLSAYLSEGLGQRPPRYVRVNGGYKLHRDYRERLTAELSVARAAPRASRQTTTAVAPSPRPSIPVSRPGVFIVHGQDEAAHQGVARFVERLGYEAIILHERANRGRTIITKFQEEAKGVEFAVVLMTPDDHGGRAGETTNARARQNVVFELGYFIGKLGADKVAALVKGDVERPSDFDGVVYISLDAGNWKTKLAQEFAAAELPVDWEKVGTA